MIARLNEMALSKSDAIEHCISIGKKFCQHFNTICDDGKTHNDFSHHCSELQAWYEDAKGIILKYNNKHLTNLQLIDWFFTAGSSAEELINEAYIDIYNDFITQLLVMTTTKQIKDILSQLL